MQMFLLVCLCPPSVKRRCCSLSREAPLRPFLRGTHLHEQPVYRVCREMHSCCTEQRFWPIWCNNWKQQLPMNESFNSDELSADDLAILQAFENMDLSD